MNTNDLDKLVSSLKRWTETQLEGVLHNSYGEVLSESIDKLEQDTYKLETLVRVVSDKLILETDETKRSIDSIREHIENFGVYVSENDQRLNEIKATVDEALALRTLIESVDQTYAKLSEESKDAYSVLISLVESQKISIFDEIYKFSELQSQFYEKTEGKFSSILETFELLDGKTNTIYETVDSLYSRLDKLAESSKLDLSENIQSVMSEIERTTETSRIFVEAAKSVLQERIDEKASTAALEAFKRSVDSLVEETKQTIFTSIAEASDATQYLTSLVDANTASIKDLQDELSTKASLDQVTALLSDKVSYKDLPSVKDGKDGKNWEFKQHPYNKSVLIFKREDKEEWQQINLAPKSIAEPVYVNGGSGVGVREAKKIATEIAKDAKITVLRDGNIVEEFLDVLEIQGDGVTVTNPSPGVVRMMISGGTGTSASDTYIGNTNVPVKTLKVIGTAETNSSGEFTFNFNITGITTVYDVDVKSYLLDGIGLDPQEKIVDCYVSEIGSGFISGIAYFNVKTGSPIGTQIYSKVPASSGIVVNVVVTGTN